MFGIKRRRRFEQAVAAEVAYMLSLHGDPSAAAEAARARAERENIGASRTRVLNEAAARLAALSAVPSQASGRGG